MRRGAPPPQRHAGGRIWPLQQWRPLRRCGGPMLAAGPVRGVAAGDREPCHHLVRGRSSGLGCPLGARSGRSDAAVSGVVLRRARGSCGIGTPAVSPVLPTATSGARGAVSRVVPYGKPLEGGALLGEERVADGLGGKGSAVV